MLGKWQNLAGAILVGMASATYANNLSITNVTLVNVTNGMADIQFDVSWSNSWRYTEMSAGESITNHDAVWLFVKYRAGGDWKHVNPADSGHTAPAGTEIKIGSNGATNIGVFLFRDSDGHGGLNADNVRLHWNYIANGLSGTNGVDISVQGIEMVYIPKGPFYLGSGGGEDNRLYKYPTVSDPFLVTNEDAITVGSSNGNLYAVESYGGGAGDRGGPVPAAFPKGYAAFYCMKYEITQGQYAHFLNRVPAGTDTLHFPDKYNVDKHTIRLTNGVYVADWPDVACNYLSWSDLAAYLDWAGLRPMSELEFEKVCRGPLSPIANEYAWGDTSATEATGVTGTEGSGTETAAPVGANSHCSRSYRGPLRAGIFATASSTRHAAGAGYYGVMELGGNLMERAITIGSPAGRSFAGTHGDGNIGTSNPDWPDVATADGAGKRGGSFYNGGVDAARTSDRRYAVEKNSDRSIDCGGRGVRTE